MEKMTSKDKHHCETKFDFSEPDKKQQQSASLQANKVILPKHIPLGKTLVLIPG